MLISFFGLRFYLKYNMVTVVATTTAAFVRSQIIVCVRSFMARSLSHWPILFGTSHPITVLKLLSKFQDVTFISWWVMTATARHTDNFFHYVCT